ncbi:hypothetical protein EXIGLDRAFT_809121 [Exidia glandulosa HHB12029]|uniref:Uncharacterized protein n=1 Tax=Exidia glandulosa HHB12029 TaxID=1314781 RepID=A0A165Q2Y2_EXIGL|nr:hypothetical protein EXIGLDRAFT_809121 [Exidia glandulosa HHB12029]
MAATGATAYFLITPNPAGGPLSNDQFVHGTKTFQSAPAACVFAKIGDTTHAASGSVQDTLNAVIDRYRTHNPSFSVRVSPKSNLPLMGGKKFGKYLEEKVFEGFDYVLVGDSRYALYCLSASRDAEVTEWHVLRLLDANVANPKPFLDALLTLQERFGGVGAPIVQADWSDYITAARAVLTQYCVIIPH